MADLASIAAATAAGFKLIEVDRGPVGAAPNGAAVGERYLCRLEKPLSSSITAESLKHVAEGISNTSAAAARTQCLLVLNNQRTFRYGAGNKNQHGDTITADTS
jgi:hypothetical protein